MSIIPSEKSEFPIGSPIVTITYLTIRPQFVILSAMLYSTGGRSLLVKILGCSLWSRSVMLLSAESEHPRLTNREIVFEEFQQKVDNGSYSNVV